ncbi:protein FAM124A-like [Saccostrea cucullata]|uniref:protein FAM124A-like n=1 Tax=Saccostrea cuccullata TaxID=36930 RepID=UPI002ED42E61
MTFDKVDQHKNSDMSSIFDPFRCKLCISVPRGKRKVLKKILHPFIKWIDPSFEFLNIQENGNQTRNSINLQEHPQQCEVEYIRAPAISVILFLAENGTMSSKDVQKSFLVPPWEYHHKVELFNVRSPERTAACQEFYGIADDMPLWSVCPVHYGNEHLRVLIYVKNFEKMVEFYRVITDCEMESNKPGFCIFQTYSNPGVDIQIALKYSKFIQPYPISTTFLAFKVTNVDSIKTFTGCTMVKISDSSFIATDPDGNAVHLHQVQNQEVSQARKSSVINNNKLQEDIKSCRSSDSHDSGRCSDSEIWNSEPEPNKSDSFATHSQRKCVPHSTSCTSIMPSKHSSNPVAKCKTKAVYL